MNPATKRLRWVAAWAAATVLLWVAFRSVAWGEVGDAVRGADGLLLVVAVALNFSILVLWTLQWRLFTPARPAPAPAAADMDGPEGGGDGGGRPSVGRMFEVVTAMSTVSNSVPFLAGQATGVHLLATRGGTGHARALSVLALDQLAEGLAKVSVLALLAFLVPLPPGLKRAAVAVTGGVALLAAGMVALAWLQRRGALDAPGRPARPGSGGPATLPARIRAFTRRFAEGLAALRSPRTLVAGLGLALAMKAAEGGAIVAVQHAVGVEVPFWGTVLVLASVGLATMVAVAPANLGVYEASAFAAYRLAGVDADTAAALAIIQHVVFLLPAAGTGWAVVTAGGRSLAPGPATAGQSGERERR